jgi:hypothetical protein
MKKKETKLEEQKNRLHGLSRLLFLESLSKDLV